MRAWDCETQQCTTSLSAGHSANGVAANAAGLYASAHVDRTVRVWDPRQGALVRASLPSHKGWVSAGVSMCTLGATRAGSIPLQGGASQVCDSQRANEREQAHR